MSVTSDILYDTLERLQDALLAGVIGVDGLSVEMLVFDDDVPYDRYEVEVELSSLASAVAASAYRLNVGLMRDLIIQTDEMTFLLSMITPGYYAVLGVEASDSLGRARFAIRDMVAQLLTEL